ncbi:MULTISPECIES: polysaccharide deacetylase [Agrobacterium]|uniref:Chitooligosaccharide deacetylase n=1 Tax=Agrobacterium tumefaciens TaxID=358 RepID=A0AAE6EI62_AGRTU|nr:MULTISPECIES: polysaccharide deacetylase [Agrobacterium]QCL77113.1 polysaccharide deacetylase [Agrobacterium tumefaciens]QCL82622.1 polysaccharide deacetylase [Agrobacterium tumefaciens]CUX70166.1 Polysaccharide deacetylase [Agrobacterium sp. NCPPB 925]
MSNKNPALPIGAPYPAYEWPQGKTSGVLLSVDVDATSPFLWSLRDGEVPDRLALPEIRSFGPRTGLYRLLDLFARYDYRASFYVPGYVAEANPEILPAIVERGHEIGLHGYFHEIVSEVSNEEFTGALEASLELFDVQVGIRPSGFRSPAWELTPHMLGEIRRHGLTYDSSLSGFDHPYDMDGMTEIPVQWAIDDAIFFKFEGGGRDRFPLQPGGAVLADWIREWRAIHRFGGLFTLTVHDWISGRAQRIALLEELLDEISRQPAAWVATADEIARHHSTSVNKGRFAIDARVPASIGPRRFGKPA